jgi:hypothetical protein
MVKIISALLLPSRIQPKLKKSNCSTGAERKETSSLFFFIVQKKTEVYRNRELKMDLVRVLSRQYHFLIFKKNFSRNTPPLFAKLVYCPRKNPEADMSIVTLP